MKTEPHRHDVTAAPTAEYRCCFCGATTWMPDAPGYNGTLHAGCPEGGTWIRRPTDAQIAELVRRADHLDDQLGLVLGTLQEAGYQQSAGP